MKTVNKTRILAECALMLALSVILSYIKVFTMPYGGSITLVSTLPLILVSYRHGTKWGLFTGLINALLVIVTGFYPPPVNSVIAFIAAMLLDYILAYMSLGTASLFAKMMKNKTVGVAFGSAMSSFLRFVCYVLSGAIFWGSYQSQYEWAEGMSVWAYSFTYNASFMIPELILVTIASALLYMKAPSFFKKQ